MILTEHANRCAANIGAGACARVAKEAAVDDLESTTTDPDRAAAVVLRLACRVAVGKRDVLNGQMRMILILAVTGRPHLVLIARIHVQDAGGSAAAQRDQAAAVDNDIRFVVENFRRAGKCDRKRIGAAVETNLAT